MEEATGLAVEKTRSFFVRCRIHAPRYGLYEDEIRRVEGPGASEGAARRRDLSMNGRSRPVHGIGWINALRQRA